MLEADVVIGTLKGKEIQGIPIMAHPPATTSDISLEEFLSSVHQYNNVNRQKQKGVKLDFKSIEAFEKSQELIKKYSGPEVSNNTIVTILNFSVFSSFWYQENSIGPFATTWFY